MQDNDLYSGHRYIMGILDILCAGFTHVICLATAPLLVFIAADFGIDTATAGYVSTLHILVQGIFALVSPIMIGWIDNRRTQLIGVTIMILGSVLSFIAPGFGMLLFSRVITGMGHGISTGCTNAIIAAWFPPKEKSMIVTVINLCIVGAVALAYTCTVPLYHMLGDSWRLVLLALGGVLLLVDICWFILARDNHALNEYLKKADAGAGRTTNAFSGMKQALSRRDVWLLCIFSGLATIVSNGINTYLPQFLQNVRGFTDAGASSIIGIANTVGAVATLTGGIATTSLGRRKAIIIPCCVLSIIFITLALMLPGTGVIIAFFIMYSFVTSFRGPAGSTIPTEFSGVTPALASSSATMSFAFGLIGTFAASPLLKLSTTIFGADNSMLIFVPLLILSMVFSLMLPETGPKGRRA